MVGNKVRRANRLARKYLSKAKKELGNKDSFYVALEKALHNYLKAKLKIETSEFSKDKISELLHKKQVDERSVGHHQHPFHLGHLSGSISSELQHSR